MHKAARELQFLFWLSAEAHAFSLLRKLVLYRGNRDNSKRDVRPRPRLRKLWSTLVNEFVLVIWKKKAEKEKPYVFFRTQQMHAPSSLTA